MRFKHFLVLPILFLLVACDISTPENYSETTFTSDFKNDSDNWIGGFADWHPPYSSNDWNFIFERTKLPAPLPQDKYAMHIGGMNRSDDLFMFMKKEIKGLFPNQQYEIVFELEIASNAPTDAMGIGGPPNALYIKAGAVLVEPDTVYNKEENLFLMKNIDKGIQSNAGKDVKLLGDIGVAAGQTQYAIIKRNNKSNPHIIKTNSTGNVWVLIGTDSAFEGRSDLYYSVINITFRKKL